MMGIFTRQEQSTLWNMHELLEYYNPSLPQPLRQACPEAPLSFVGEIEGLRAGFSRRRGRFFSSLNETRGAGESDYNDGFH
jgi:hypothetical protein